MCELLGMSALHPTNVNHSLALLRPRGGQIGPHADGWGVAFYEGRAARVFKEPVPAADSRCLAFIAEYNYQSTLVIGHIRKANPPEFGRTSANTHPFSRELGGRAWVFAHNGKLPGLRDDPRFSLGRFLPMGETDSEHAFCFLLDRIASAQHAATNPASPPLALVLHEHVAELDRLGELNFLLSNGEELVAYSNTRLSWARRACREHGCAQSVVLLATTPLTDEAWRQLAPGKIHVFAHGERVTTGGALGGSAPSIRPGVPSTIIDQDQEPAPKSP